MERIGRALAILVLLVGIASTTACESTSWTTVQIVGNHPWEKASGRQFWYTLLYRDDSALRQVNLPIGVRSLRIMVPKARTTIFAAYPLGTGVPFGGAYHAVANNHRVELSMYDGPLAGALLQVSKQWPDPVAELNFTRIARMVKTVDPSGTRLDWNHLATDIVTGAVSEASFRTSGSRSIVIESVPQGRWIGELVDSETFFVFADQEVALENLSPGIVRYVNLDHGLELRIAVPDNAQDVPFWHMVPMDLLLRLSDWAYHELVHAGDAFTY